MISRIWQQWQQNLKIKLANISTSEAKIWSPCEMNNMYTIPSIIPSIKIYAMLINFKESYIFFIFLVLTDTSLQYLSTSLKNQVNLHI